MLPGGPSSWGQVGAGGGQVWPCRARCQASPGSAPMGGGTCLQPQEGRGRDSARAGPRAAGIVFSSSSTWSTSAANPFLTFQRCAWK